MANLFDTKTSAPSRVFAPEPGFFSKRASNRTALFFRRGWAGGTEEDAEGAGKFSYINMEAWSTGKFLAWNRLVKEEKALVFEPEIGYRGRDAMGRARTACAGRR